MKSICTALTSLLLLAGCASAPPVPPIVPLLRDDLFALPSVVVAPEQALALSAPMRDYLDSRLRKVPAGMDRRRWLMDALYRRDELRLEYDAGMTRTAAQAFEARTGNCLALAMMTGAFAKAMGLSVRYQLALGEEAFDRAGDIAISIGHVNLTLDDRAQHVGLLTTDRDPWTIDFLPSSDGRRMRTRTVQEHTVVAMFLNNRAVESFVAGQVDDAYWWAREAVRHDPDLLMAHVTLGVIYRSRQQPALAEAVLARVGEREPDNLQALANRILALRDLGRPTDADALQQRLDRLDPHPRFSDFGLGMAALRERRFEDARRLFAQEVARTPGYHAFHFWLAVAYAELNDPAHAAKALAQAMAASTTRRDHDLYAAKLDKLKALRAQ